MHSQTATHSILSSRPKLGFLFIPWIFLFCLVMNPSAKAQVTLEAGVFLGDAYYLGDLNPDVHFRMAQIAYGALVRYNIDTRWALKLGITRGKVKGNSEKSNFLPGRNLQFESPITDFSVTAEFNFFEYFTGSRWNWITPYLYAGIGGFIFQPTSGGANLRSAGTEGQNIGYEGRKPYNTIGVNIPFGLGVKVSIGKKVGLTLFWEMHKTFTDYIDDVSSTYYLNGPAIDPNDQNAILSDPSRSHTAGMQRGNPKSNDWYSFSGITVTYKFDIRGSRKCKENKHF
ncbi:MAG: DUF6089 family protein [Bacteroidetes bacterium]|nr:DUF6089 family protein [Bacteroidota bacterium]